MTRDRLTARGVALWALFVAAAAAHMHFEQFVVPAGYRVPSAGTVTLRFFDGHTATVLKPRELPTGAVPVAKVAGSYAEVNHGGFEPETYRVFRQWITNGTDYIGFGCGPGLLLLYAANLARRAIGLDGDPIMQLLARTNAALNPSLPVTVLPHCVASEPGANVTFFAKHPGSTESSAEATYVSLISRSHRHHMYRWTMPCLTIPEVIRREGLRPPFFWKVDIEGFEAELVPHWEPWIRSMRPHDRPTIYVQIHQWGGKWPQHQMDKWKHLLSTLYTYVYFVSDEASARSMLRVSAADTRWELCFPSCSYVLTEVPAKGCVPRQRGFYTEACPIYA